MRRIELQSLTLECFRSFRKRATIELTPTAGLKFIAGDNQAQPRLGANGAGKSTIWDGLAFCLYGTSVKGLRAAELTSWGEKTPYACAMLVIEGASVKVERFGSPNRLLLNEEPVEQIAVDRILGISRLRFLQTVIFGQAVPLFIDLSVPERGGLLDEVLDLGLWLHLSETASAKHRALSQELNEAARSISFLNGKLEGLPKIEELEQRSASWTTEQDQCLDKAILAVEQAEKELELRARKVLSCKAAVTALPSDQAMRADITSLTKRSAELEASYRGLHAELSAATRMADFFHNRRTCPECSQAIDPLFARKRHRDERLLADTIQERMAQNGGQAGLVATELNQVTAEQQKLARKREFLIEQRATAEADLRAQQDIVNGAVRAAELVAAAENPHDKAIANAKEVEAETRQAIREAEGVRRRTQGAALRMDFWRSGFKRVRLFLVQRILRQLEIETATAAVALGLAGWKISFATELETKSGTLRPGIHIQVSSPTASASWEAWSGGEAQRIRLAVALGLASMIQRLAGISVGFEVWDEPSAWLSPEGIEDLLDCLRRRVETTGKALYICDHRALIYSGFAEIWTVTKTNEGSKVALSSVAEGG